jgi:beta-lactamase class D
MKAVLTVLMLFSFQVFAEDRELASIFEKNNANGTIILSSLDGTTYVYNQSRSQTRYTAASTFKIANSLIALEEQIITNSGAKIKWNGYRHEFEVWNRDQTLKTAFQVSCVWCYQEFATKIGSEKYKAYLTRMPYGQIRETFNLTSFWLDGSLKISSAEQIYFLKQIYLRKLPFSEKSYNTLSEIMTIETTPTYIIRAKTGWANASSPQIGWYVGYVELKNKVWFFALNLDILKPSDLALRKSIVDASLKAKGILEYD